MTWLNNTQENSNHNEVVLKMKQAIWENFVRVQLVGWRVWPAAALVSYGLIPVRYRVLYINCVGTNTIIE